MVVLNLGLRFLLELAGIAALAYWGWNATADPGWRLAAAVVAPFVLIAIWGLVVAPRATNAIPHPQRVLIGSGLLEVAAFALFVAGQQAVAIAFAAVVVVNTALMLLFGGPEATLRRRR